MNDKIKQIIEYYGVSNQLKYIHSEYFELDEAIIEYELAKDLPNLEIFKNHVAEEMADVLVMLKQFQLYFDIPDEQINQIMKSKVDRQINRIEEEK